MGEWNVKRGREGKREREEGREEMRIRGENRVIGRRIDSDTAKVGDSKQLM